MELNFENIFICSQGPYRVVNSDRDLATLFLCTSEDCDKSLYGTALDFSIGILWERAIWRKVPQICPIVKPFLKLAIVKNGSCTPIK